MTGIQAEADWKIRPARLSDLERLLEIYNHEVRSGVATLDLRPRTLEEWRSWFDAHQTAAHPLYVGERDGVVLGYVSLSPYRTKEAYASTAELSVYIAPEARGAGVATGLMTFILNLARENETLHNVVSVITAGNATSVYLHQKFGFTYCGTIPQVGVKFGQYRDIENYSLIV